MTKQRSIIADFVQKMTITLTAGALMLGITPAAEAAQTPEAQDAAPRSNDALVFPNTLTPYDAEQNEWSWNGSSWQTVRGGSLMTVTDASAYGIDVSEWQHDIDWTAAQADGVQFAILRCGLGYSDNTGRMDNYFMQNVQACKRYGIPFGVYLYTYAQTPSQGTDDARRVLEYLSQAGVRPSDMAHPVYYDLENANQLDFMDAAGRGSLAEAFCTAISAAGYKPGIYANANWFTNYLTDQRFSNWTKWVASYPYTGKENASTTYAGKHDMWQCMSSGVVDGISTRVDIDFYYKAGHTTGAGNNTASVPVAPSASPSGRYNSAIFNYDYYAANNPDVVAVFGRDEGKVYNHFVQYGMNEGRRASESFDPQSYYNANVDLRRAFGFNIRQYYTHYLQNGQKEHRVATGASEAITDGARVFGATNYAAVFSPSYYGKTYADLQAVYGKNPGRILMLDDQGLLDHFVMFGMGEGRQGSEAFNVEGYYNSNPDLRAAIGANIPALYNHYITHGVNENRSARATKEIAGAVTMLNGYDYSKVYDAGVYANNYADLLRAFSTTVGRINFVNDGALLQHFVDYGMAEGRVAHPSFNVHAYRSNNPDLIDQFGDDLKIYYIHYITSGYAEGRAAV